MRGSGLANTQLWQTRSPVKWPALCPPGHYVALLFLFLLCNERLLGVFRVEIDVNTRNKWGRLYVLENSRSLREVEGVSEIVGTAIG